MTDFGKRLKQLRKESGMTQKQLAKRIWVTKATISNYELYERTPAPEILINLSQVFHVSIDYLLGIEDKKRTLDVSDLTDEEIQFLETAIRLFRKKSEE